MTATEIVDGIYDVTCRLTEGGKRYRVFLDATDGPTMFDAGLPGTADAVVAGVEAVGVDPERLVITHGDGDHVGGFDALVEAFDLETWVPAETALESMHEIDHRYGDGDRIGGYEAVHVPGHEPDNHALVDEDQGVAVLGDAVSGADQRGLPAGYFHLPPGVYSDDLVRAEASLERLLEYEFDAGLVFHGSSVTADAREKLDRYVNFPGKPDSG